jgi:hypothetical protein
VDPVTTSSCKHTFCRDCITRALKHNSSCPIDRSALTLSSLHDTEPLVQLMLDELHVRCEADGCRKVMQRGLLLAHLRSCSQAIITCGDGDCGLSVRSRSGLSAAPTSTSVSVSVGLFLGRLGASGGEGRSLEGWTIC